MARSHRSLPLSVPPSHHEGNVTPTWWGLIHTEMSRTEDMSGGDLAEEERTNPLS